MKHKYPESLYCGIEIISVSVSRADLFKIIYTLSKYPISECLVQQTVLEVCFGDIPSTGINIID